jgi:hypothetical protein
MGALGANRMNQSICVSSSQTSGILAGGYAWYAARQYTDRMAFFAPLGSHTEWNAIRWQWDIAVSQILGLEAHRLRVFA